MNLPEQSPQPLSEEKPLARATQTINVWATAVEVGVLIALPLVVLVLLGIKADRYFGTMPLFIICGMLLSMVVSTVAIARKIRRLG